MTPIEKRVAVRDKYREIIGRNIYSQAKREYCYKKYSDGKYYSDCSSSVSYAYKEAGFGFGILNTVGMYNQIGKKFTKVPVEIKNGQILNPEVLCIGDMLLYRGTDSSRPEAVGHVEMLGEISGGKYYLYGHGSGNPKKTEMTSKNKSRYNSKTSTKWGNKGLFCVVRFIQDDDRTEDVPEIDTGVKLANGSWNLRTGPGKEYDSVCTVDSPASVEVVAKLVGIDGWLFVKIGNRIGFISTKAVEGVES